MSQPTEQGVTVSMKHLGYVIAVITILGFIYTATTKVNGWDFRISKLEQDNQVLSSEVSKVADKLSDLNDKLVSLTITLSRVEERMDARTGKK